MTKLAHTNNLLASIAVFAELCNSENDLKAIVTEFVKSVFVLEKNYNMDSNEVTLLLKKHYDFELPEAVIKTCLNHLVSKELAIKTAGKYSVTDEKVQTEELNKLLNDKKRVQLQIEGDLILHCESLTGKSFDEQARRDIIDNFISYLMDNGVTDKYSALISAFVIKNSTNDNFVLELSQIKEGLVLITGLAYTSDINQINLWENELTIFLDTEHLFNSAGYNGEVYKKLFDDFYNLVVEVNQSSLKRANKKLIHLKYFKDVKEEADVFFSIAQKIIKREDNTSPQNIAMQSICKGCSSVSDILRKKTEFETNLRVRGIIEQEEFDFYSKPEYNIEDRQLLEKYIKKFEENQIAEVLSNFTKVNYLRRGVNRTSFEKVGYIILTGKMVSLILSKDLEIKNEAKDIPFATDIYFITNRIWYKLNKGFSNSQLLPSTLDIVVKAQIILSSQVNRSIDREYENLKGQLKKGDLSNESAQHWYNSLREQAKKPEEINMMTVEKSIDLIFENDFEKYVKEKEHLKEEAKLGQAAMKELHKIKQDEKNRKREKHKRRLVVEIKLFVALVGITIVALLFGSAFLIYIFKTDADTPLSILGLVLTICLELWALWKASQILIKKFKKSSKQKYFHRITK